MNIRTTLPAIAAMLVLHAAAAHAQYDGARWSRSSGSGGRYAFATERPRVIVVVLPVLVPTWRGYTRVLTEQIVRIPPVYRAPEGGSTQRGVAMPPTPALQYVVPGPQYHPFPR
jgi:hypothetical protein